MGNKFKSRYGLRLRLSKENATWRSVVKSSKHLLGISTKYTFCAADIPMILKNLEAVNDNAD